MATTISGATLTVLVSEAITLGGQTINGSASLALTSVNKVDKRIVAVPSSGEVTLMLLSTAVAAGQYIAANLKYIRITNRDDTNFIRVRVKKTGADTFDI